MYTYLYYIEAFSRYYIFITLYGYTLATDVEIINHLPKCNTIEYNANVPCIYNFKEAKKLLPLVSLSSTNVDFSKGYKSSDPREHIIDLHNENWSRVNKGHIHFLYRSQGPSGSLGVDENQLQVPTHSSYCTSHESSYNAVNFAKAPPPLTSSTTTSPISSHSVKNCIPVSHLRHFQYTTLIGVGTPVQYIRPLLDTGSTNTWIVSADCTSETCSNVNKFDPKLSSTLVELYKGYQLKIKFGTGSIIGKPVSDTVIILDTKIEKQTFGLVEQEISDGGHHNVFEKLKFEGIIGLGFPQMAWNNHVPLFDNFSNAINADLTFSLYFSNNKKYSALLFGGVDKRFYSDEIIMLPLIREYYWEVKMLEFWVGDIKLCCIDESYVIFDSGTSFNTLPHDTFNTFKSLIPPVKCDSDNLDDIINKLPDLKYVLTGNITITLKPEQYLFIAKDLCKPAFMQINVPSSFGQAYILGTSAFMQHYYTVYQRSTTNLPAMVGFAPALHSEDNQKYIENFDIKIS